MERAMKEYVGRIFHVDLSWRALDIELPGEEAYHRCLGGSCLGVDYLLTMKREGIGPLDPENVIVFSIGPATGAAVSGLSRHDLTDAKSTGQGRL